MATTNSIRKGDYVEKNTEGTVRFGIVNDDNFEHQGRKIFNVKNGPARYSVVGEETLTKLNSKTEQKKSVEKERRQCTLQIALRLAEIQRKTEWAMSRIERKSDEISKPNTGFFIVVGVYSGNGPHLPYITAVYTLQPTTEEEISKKLSKTYPNGFATIPGQSKVLPGTSHGSLVKYQCHELPPRAAKLIDWELQQV